MDLRRPLTGLAVAYVLGIWIGSLTSWPVMILCVVAAALLAVFLLLRQTRWSLPLLLAAVVVAGAAGYRRVVTISSPNDITRLLEPRDQNVQMQGVIVTDTGYRVLPLNEDDAERERFELELTAVERSGRWQTGGGSNPGICQRNTGCAAIAVRRSHHILIPSARAPSDAESRCV